MIKFSTFHKGGIHPDDMKYASKDIPIEKMKMPGILTIPMSQHIGAPAKILKDVGDSVIMGEKIGEAASFVSANIHSPANGKVLEIKKVTLANGISSDAIVIQTDDNQPEKFSEKLDWKNENPKALVDVIREMGIVGQGGATFPTNVKFSLPPEADIEALIINCVECEPYLTADYRLVLEKMDEFLEGVSICKYIINPKKVIIAFEANKKELAVEVDKRIRELSLNFDVDILKMKYPQGDEKQLVKACINKEIPSGKLPSDVGAVVVNAGSAWAIYNAVALRKPLIERVVTVSGSCIKNPKNLLVPIGTSVQELIDFAGGFSSEPDKIISGGPMMGFSFYDTETPIIKGNNGLIFIKDEITSKQTACLSCGRCVAVCPLGLEPTVMYHLITNGKYEEALKKNLLDCKECGCCTYTCPAHLNLVQAFKLGKKLGRKK